MVPPSNCALIVTAADPAQTSMKTEAKTRAAWFVGALKERITDSTKQTINGPLLLKYVCESQLHVYMREIAFLVSPHQYTVADIPVLPEGRQCGNLPQVPIFELINNLLLVLSQILCRLCIL